MAERVKMSAWKLEHEDWVNMLCGVPWTYEIMAYLENAGKKSLYTYYGGFEDDFRWNRAKIWGMADMEICKIYGEITTIGKN